VDDVLLAIKTLLETADSGNVYAHHFYGVNTVPSQSEMPFIEIKPGSTSMERRGTNSMNNEFQVVIRVVDSLKNFVTEDTNKEVVSHTQTFVKRMEERDSNGKPLASTILGVLHDNMRLNNKVTMVGISTVRYDEINNPHDGSWIIEATMVVTAKLISLRS